MKRLAAILILQYLTGCATVTHGRFQKIPVTSEPSGADIELAQCGAGRGGSARTPAIVSVRRNADGCTITLHKDGYESAHIVLRRDRSRALYANALPAIVLGAATGLVAAIPFVLGDSQGAHDAADASFKIGFAAGAAAPFLVDSKTGAAYRQFPDSVHVALHPAP